MAKENQLKFNGKEIADADAVKLIEAIHPKRSTEIIAGLRSGVWGQCTVAGGILTADVTR